MELCSEYAKRLNKESKIEFKNGSILTAPFGPTGVIRGQNSDVQFYDYIDLILDNIVSGSNIVGVEGTFQPIAVNTIATVLPNPPDGVWRQSFGEYIANSPDQLATTSTLNTSVNNTIAGSLNQLATRVDSVPRIYAGVNTFSGSISPRVISHNLGNSITAVTITPRYDCSYVGDYWARWDNSDIYVFSTGNTQVEFSYIAVAT